jgi:hypothetical protein
MQWSEPLCPMGCARECVCWKVIQEIFMQIEVAKWKIGMGRVLGVGAAALLMAGVGGGRAVAQAGAGGGGAGGGGGGGGPGDDGLQADSWV